MKKIFLLFSAVGLLSLTGCTNDDDNYGDGDTIAEVFEVSNVDFSTNDVVNSITIPLDPAIYSSDMVLVYRLSGITPSGKDIFELMPTTYHFDNGTANPDFLSYYFDFSVDDVVVYLESNFDLSGMSDYTDNQVLRVMIIPGYGSNFRTSASSLEQFKDYDAVVKKYGIKESNIKQISVK